MVDIKKINGHNLEDTTAREKLNTIADYIVEIGTQDSWDYEKWNSGKIVLRNVIGAANLKMTYGTAGTYYDSAETNDRIVCNLPLITKIDYTYGTIRSDSNHGLSSGVFLYQIWSNGVNQITVSFRSHASVSSGSGYANIEVIGKWK